MKAEKLSLKDLLGDGEAFPKGTEFIFLDELPKCYLDDDLFGMEKLSGIFARLSGELNGVMKIRSRVIGRLEGNLQIICIDHDGSITQEDLDRLNKEFSEIQNGKIYSDRGRHGNLMAADVLRRYNGYLKIERINENPYFVRTTITIPIPEQF